MNTAACPTPCIHRHCDQMRTIADSECAYCVDPIGFDSEFIDLGPAGVAHSKCVKNAPCTGVLGLSL